MYKGHIMPLWGKRPQIMKGPLKNLLAGGVVGNKGT